jgi:SmpA / OmlA family
VTRGARESVGTSAVAIRSRGLWILTTALLGAACRHPASPATLPHFESRNLFTCCNLHYETENVSDANYWAGEELPAGTPVHVDKVTADSVTFTGGGATLTLTHEYGTAQESLQQYIDKVLVPTDPRARIAAYPAAVRRAIHSARVERGMTREQVIAALGYPPTHHTPSVQDKEWTYWYNHWASYEVVFDDAGKVADVIGRPAPTAQLPIK